jgi:hypothetical protein
MKVKLSHIGVTEVQLYPSLSYPLDGNERSASYRGRFTHWIGGWVGSGTHVAVSGEELFLACVGIRTPDRPGRIVVAVSTKRPRLMFPTYQHPVSGNSTDLTHV